MNRTALALALTAALSTPAMAAPLVTHLDNLGTVGTDATPVSATETVGATEFWYTINFATDAAADVGSVVTIGLEITGDGFDGGFDAAVYVAPDAPLAVGDDLGGLVPVATASALIPALFVIDAPVDPSQQYSYVVHGTGLGPNSTVASLVGIASVSEVPVPAAAWLFGAGLVGLAGVARKRNAQHSEQFYSA